MNRDVKAAIAQIQVGKRRGVGFLVGERAVVTALHVIANLSKTRVDDFSLEEHRYDQIARLRFGDPDDGGTFEKTALLDADNVLCRVGEDQALIVLANSARATPLPSSVPDATLANKTWETYGFPDVAPDKGIVVSGLVRDPGRGQLFSDEAAAGDGLRVAGLSGAPCLVDNVAVGMLIESLGTTVNNQGGTLFFGSLKPLHEQAPQHFARWCEAVANVPDTQTRLAILTALGRLLPAMFDEVLFRVQIPEHFLAGVMAPQAQRAQQAVRYMEEQGRLAELSDAIRKVGGRVL